ncbi:collagen-like protein [Aureococcus anophagefferens]|uniref:Collagen-like protein n=1 Tax=Aureococcus anophagefferens TaxID=44056 RepID=A0ABR1G9P9_AURAN
MAARDATMHRLRLLQAACAPLGSPGEQPEAWLFVCGVDGKDNWGSAAALRWLVLGESGRGLLEERVRPFFVGSDVPLASDADREAVAEALEETVLLVTRSTVSLLYDARAAPALATLLVCPGLREYVVECAGGDVDAAEAAKAAGFVRLVACEVGAAGARVGVVLPRGAESAAEDVEYWPLVQALAVGEAPGLHGRGDFGGFFSQRHDVVDATATFKACVGALDGALLRDRLAASTPALRQHVEETFRAMRGPGGLGVAPDLTEARAAERLAAFFDYGEAEHPAVPKPNLQPDFNAPFALLGTRTSSSMCADGASDATAADATAPQIVVQARDPTSGLRLCRTYVLGAGVVPVVPGDDDDDDDDDRETAAPAPAAGAAGEGALLTGDRCAPYAQPFGACGGPEFSAAGALARRLRDVHFPRATASRARGSRASRGDVAGDARGAAPPAALTGRLDVYERGFVLHEAGVAPLVAAGLSRSSRACGASSSALVGALLGAFEARVEGDGDRLHGVVEAPGRGAPPSRPAGVVALLGAPGSGVGDVAAALLRRGRESDGVAWVHVEGAVDAATLALDLPPGVVDACLGGFATGVVLVDSAAGLSSAAAEAELQRRLKLGRRAPRLARAGRGGALTTAAVADVIARCDDLDADAFAAPAMEARARRASARPGARLAGPAGARASTLAVAAPRDRDAARPALRRLLDNARAKVEGKKAVDGRLAALDHDLRAFRAKRRPSSALTAVAGSLRLAENGRRVAAPCGLDGNARVASLWAQPRNHARRWPRRRAGAFDGSAYYASFDGIRTKLRPDIDALVDAHLAGLNAQIDRENAAIAGRVSGGARPPPPPPLG